MWATLAWIGPFRHLPPPRPERVAVLGRGPAGLASAYFLANAGVQVSVVEREQEPGGMLRYGIPPYRLPKEVLIREINNLVTSLGIDLHLGQDLAPAQIPGLLETADFVFCAPGLWSSQWPKELPESPLIHSGLEVLRRINSGQNISGSSFAVIGGGNVAVDVARSLLRLGKTVHIVYRRSFAQMPAYDLEKQQALEEGVHLHEQALTAAIDVQDTSLHITLAQALSQDGKIVPGEHSGSLQVDGLLVATGQAPHCEIQANERILIGGDLLLGPATVVQAMATGRQGARTILERIDPDLVHQADIDIQDLPVLSSHHPLEYVPKEKPVQEPLVDVNSRSQGFAEIHSGLNQSQVQEAASRCLQCTHCTGCGICWFFCPDVAISLEEGPEGETEVHIDQEHCKGCGLCAAVCPRGMIEMEEDV